MFIETKSIRGFLGVTGPASSGRPYLNVPQLGIFNYANSVTLADKKTIMFIVKRTPEAIGIVRAIAMDIVTKLEFKAIDEKKTGRPTSLQTTEDKAKRFAKENQIKQLLLANMMDWLITGEFFTWIGVKTERDIKEIIHKQFRNFGIEIETKEIEVKDYLDEDPDDFKQLVYVPSTTVSISINKEATSVDSYIQETHLRKRIWDVDQIIHGKFMEVDGKVNGFTPMEAAIPILKTLGLIKDYAGNFFDSGGTPDLLFIFKNLAANDPALAKWQQVVDEWATKMRRGHLVIGAEEFQLERVNEMNKDMEFRMLAIYYTGILAFAFGMPLEKFQAILGGEISSSTGSSDLGNADYQRNISDMQDYVENLFNTQFWNIHFKVDMILNRGFLQDQLRKIEMDTMKASKIQSLVSMGVIKAENIPDLVHQEFPEIPRDWIETDVESILQMSAPQTQTPRAQLNGGTARESYSNQKKAQQKPQQRNSKPTGN